MKMTNKQKAIWLAEYFTWIFRHPLNRDQPLDALRRYLRWHIGSRLVGQPILYPFVNDLRIELATSMWGATSVAYFGLDEYADMAFCAHLLRSSDLFVDVGACFGTYSLLASGVGGARSIAFEPNPRNARQIVTNARLNHLEQLIDVRESAVGANSATVRMTGNQHAANHVLNTAEVDTSALEVPVVKLDDVLADLAPTLLKIDVEGFEPAVLEGAQATIRKPSLLAVIVEDVGLASRYGNATHQHEVLLDAGFQSFSYQPENRRLESLGGQPNPDGMNTLYLRNIPEVEKRIRTAPLLTVRSHKL